MELSKQISKNIIINIRPWPRAIKEAQGSRSIIYPFARTEYRENNYLWLGPITEAYHVMVVPSSDKRKYMSLADFKSLNIGVLRNAPPNKILVQQGFQNLTPLGLSSSIAKMLKVNRIEAWYDAKSFIEYHLLDNGIKADNFRIAFVDRKMSFYIGFSKDLKDEFLLWEKAFNNMKKNGKLRELQNKYELKLFD